jgi:PAS domain S-box-containing protein
VAFDTHDSTLGAQLRQLAAEPSLLKHVFDTFTDTIFYIKDAKARYLLVNELLITRAGFSRDEVIGKTADQLFSATGLGNDAQAFAVMEGKVPIIGRLRLYATALGKRYWCLSSLFPIIDANGSAIGLIGVGRDLPQPDKRHNGYRRLLNFSNYVEQHLSQKILITKAAQHASISVDALERYTKEVFHLTPKQLLMKMRIDRACRLLEQTDISITDIATECGYSDHSAFSRQFKSATHLTPRIFRTARGAAR